MLYICGYQRYDVNIVMPTFVYIYYGNICPRIDVVGYTHMMTKHVLFIITMYTSVLIAWLRMNGYKTQRNVNNTRVIITKTNITSCDYIWIPICFLLIIKNNDTSIVCNCHI